MAILPPIFMSRSRLNTITYCHYPTAKFLIESRDEEYLNRYLKISRAEKTSNRDIGSITFPSSGN